VYQFKENTTKEAMEATIMENNALPVDRAKVAKAVNKRIKEKNAITKVTNAKRQRRGDHSEKALIQAVTEEYQ
jgi:hypothetical protein